jgi:hypothetical protein
LCGQRSHRLPASNGPHPKTDFKVASQAAGLQGANQERQKRGTDFTQR